MDAIFSAIPLITSGLALVAFVVAVGFLALRAWLNAKAKAIQNAPEADRLKAMEAADGYFRVSTETLTKAQRQEVILSQIAERAKAQTRWFVLLLAVAVLLAAVAMLAIVNTKENGITSPTEADVSKLASGNPTEVIAALERLSRAGKETARENAVCTSISTYVQEHAALGQLQLAGTLRGDIQAAVATLSALQRSGSCGSARLAGVDLQRLELPNAMLAGWTLANSRLDEAVLTGADLSGADLTGVNLTDANLTNAKLAKAKFGVAVLEGTIFTGSTDACVKGASNLGEAIGVSDGGKQC